MPRPGSPRVDAFLRGISVPEDYATRLMPMNTRRDGYAADESPRALLGFEVDSIRCTSINLIIHRSYTLSAQPWPFRLESTRYFIIRLTTELNRG